MATVTLSQPRSDSVRISIGRSPVRVTTAFASLVLWSAAAWLTGFDSGPGLTWLVVGLALVPWLAIRALRSLRTTHRLLTRASGRLALDGEPVELARLELRMLKMPIVKVPTGYALSLWVMTASGPEDVPLGRYPTLLGASQVSGVLEDFIQRSSKKQPGRTGA